MYFMYSCVTYPAALHISRSPILGCCNSHHHLLVPLIHSEKAGCWGPLGSAETSACEIQINLSLFGISRPNVHSWCHWTANPFKSESQHLWMFALQLNHLIIDELIKMNELIILFNGAYFCKMVALGLALLQHEGCEFESQLQQAFSA